MIPPRGPFAEFIREVMGPGVYDEADRLFGLFNARQAVRAESSAVPRVRRIIWPWKMFALPPEAPREVYAERYRELAMGAHPDRPGGSHRRMVRVNKAWDIIRSWRGW